MEEVNACQQGVRMKKNKCNDKEFCASPNTSCTEAFPKEETGVCISVNDSFSRLTGTDYHIANGPLSWWDAEAGCQALGYNGSASVSDLIKDWDGTPNWQKNMNLLRWERQYKDILI